jgi:hypothetical protein
VILGDRTSVYAELFEIAHEWHFVVRLCGAVVGGHLSDVIYASRMAESSRTWRHAINKAQLHINELTPLYVCGKVKAEPS